MSEKPQYITVAQYAEIKGISKQAVYKRLNNLLQPFLIVVESRKYIDIAALTAEEQGRLFGVEQPFEQPENNQNQPTAEFWQRQIEEKDSTIASLLRQIDILQEQNSRLTDTIQEQNSRLTELLANSQLLLAAEKKEKTLLLEEETTTTKRKKGIFGIFRKKGDDTK